MKARRTKNYRLSTAELQRSGYLTKDNLYLAELINNFFDKLADVPMSRWLTIRR